MGLPLAMFAGSALGGALAGYLGRSKPQNVPYGKIVYPETYGFNKSRWNELYNYASGGLKGTVAGMAPAWWRNMRPELERQQERSLREAYYGTPMSRGTSAAQIAASQGAMLGLGPKGTLAQQRKVSDAYMQSRRELAALMSQQEADVTERAGAHYANVLGAIPQSRPYQVVGAGGGGQAGGFNAELAGAVGKGLYQAMSANRRNAPAIGQANPYPASTLVDYSGASSPYMYNSPAGPANPYMYSSPAGPQMQYSNFNWDFSNYYPGSSSSYIQSTPTRGNYFSEYF